MEINTEYNERNTSKTVNNIKYLKNSTIFPSKHATFDNTRTFILIFKQIKIQIYIYRTILYSIDLFYEQV